MSTFCIKLAGIPVKVTSVYDSTRDFCKDYLTDEAPTFAVEITEADIEDMRQRDRQTATAEGRKPVNHSENYLETLALASVVLEKLIDYGVLMLHGAVVAKDGGAYLFTAKSGVGKTTHCNLWLKNIPKSYILNGDKPLLLFKDGAVYACGSPWQGKENMGVNEALPLKAVCVLERAEQNEIEKTSLLQVLGELINQAHHPKNGQRLVDAVRLIGQLRGVGIYRLKCNMDDSAATVAYGGMTENKK